MRDTRRLISSVVDLVELLDKAGVVCRPCIGTPGYYAGLFKVEQNENLTIFTNNSSYDLWISLKPIKPKRKYHDIMVVAAGQFVIYDHTDLDLSKVSFSLNHKHKGKS